MTDEEMEKHSYAFECRVCDSKIYHGFMLIEGQRGHDWEHPGYNQKPLELSEGSFDWQSPARFKKVFDLWCKELHEGAKH